MSHVDDLYLDVPCRSKSGCGPTNDQAVDSPHNVLTSSNFQCISRQRIDQCLGGFLFLLAFPQHRAVVEATHPKNAPFAYLEAGQFKNSLVTTGLKKDSQREQELKFKASKKKTGRKKKKKIIQP